MAIKKKTIKECLKELPEPYRSQALQNTDESLLQCNGSTKIGALITAFHWSQTPQGYEYWNKLFMELKRKSS